MPSAGRASLAIALLLCACAEKPAEPLAPPSPALWQVESPQGEIEGWLFGTIHALPEGVDWRSRILDGVIGQADELVVEAFDITDAQTTAQVLAMLATDTGTPPLAERLAPADREALEELAKAKDFDIARFDRLESWAAALGIAAAISAGSSGSGVDAALLEEFKGKQIEQFEGVERQLRIFDGLPEDEQRDLLHAVILEAQKQAADPGRLSLLWRAGDVDELAREGEAGILGDPELRAALLVERNLDWVRQLQAMLAGKEKVLVAVGTAHMTGPDGLPALLEARGYRVHRIE